LLFLYYFIIYLFEKEYLFIGLKKKNVAREAQGCYLIDIWEIPTLLLTSSLVYVAGIALFQPTLLDLPEVVHVLQKIPPKTQHGVARISPKNVTDAELAVQRNINLCS
jgi:hypothetical protein